MRCETAPVLSDYCDVGRELHVRLPVVHPSAIIDDGAILGDACRIWHFCHVSPGARIGAGSVLGQNCYVAPTAVLGRGCKVQNNVSLYDSVTLEDDVFVGPSAVFTNVINPRAFVERKHEYRPTVVKRGASIGANATIVCGVIIGEYAMVGAGAVVRRDVEPHAVVVGVPAGRHGWICECGATRWALGGATISDAELMALARQVRCPTPVPPPAAVPLPGRSVARVGWVREANHQPARTPITARTIMTKNAFRICNDYTG